MDSEGQHDGVDPERVITGFRIKQFSFKQQRTVMNSDEEISRAKPLVKVPRAFWSVLIDIIGIS